MINKKTLLLLGTLLLIGAIIISTKTLHEEHETIKEEANKKTNTQEQTTINYQQYNHQFVDEDNVEEILDNLIGTQGKNAFYLPPTGYINTSKGTTFGVAFAINNPEPSGNNYFTYEFTADNSTMNNCEVDKKTAQSWIAMGQKSFGKIPKGWVDKMTVYFNFENVSKPCTATYHFELQKDGTPYAEKTLIFNLQ